MSTYIVEILNSFNIELQLKDSEFVIKDKIIKSFFGLRGFKSVTELVLEFKKGENDDETKYTFLNSNSKTEVIINKSDIDDILELYYVIIFQIYCI